MIESPSKENNKLLVLICLIVVYAFAIAYVIISQPINRVSSDFYKRWYPTVMLIQENRSLYDPKNGEDIVAIMPIEYDPIFANFSYPAHLLIFTLPLAFFPIEIALFVWLVVIQLVLLAGILIASRQFNWPASINGLTALLIATIFSIPAIQNTLWGQFNTISVICLSLTVFFLARNQYFLAGIFLAGLTFKPQVMVLPLLFLLGWSMIRVNRWRLLLGFLATLLVLWAFGEFFERNWVASFIKETIQYSSFHQPASGLGKLGISDRYIPILMLLGFGLIAWINRKAKPVSSEFLGCLVLSTLMGWLLVPALGIMHLLAMPIILTYLISALKINNSKLYRIVLTGTILIYFLGLIGFIFAATQPGLYGMHIKFIELMYNSIMPIFFD
jgi:hypothetical protein